MLTWIIISIFCAIMAATVASSKGRNGAGWLFLGFLIGPFALAVALLPSLKEPNATTTIIPPTRKCPFCAEFIKTEAIICRFCGRDVPEYIPEKTGQYYCSLCKKYDAYYDAVNRLFCPHCKEYVK